MNSEEEQKQKEFLIALQAAEEQEKREKAEDSKKQLKAILFTFIPLLVGFLVFTYYFLNSIEEKAQAQRRLEIREAKKLERRQKALENQQNPQPPENEQSAQKQQ